MKLMKQTKHATRISFLEAPRIVLYGEWDVNMKGPHVFEAKDVAQVIVNSGKPALQYRKMHRGSMTLGDQAALFNAYMHSELWEYELPQEIESPVHQLFEEEGAGTVADNACYYMEEDSGLAKLKDTDVPVMWTVYPGEFVRTAEGWRIKTSEISEQFPSHLPESGYTEMTFDGLFMPESGSPYRPRGVPISTVPTKKAAVDSWVRAGIEEGLANKLVSYFRIRKYQRGVAVVVRRNDRAGKGPFYTTVTQYPDGKLHAIGSLPVGRHARQFAYGP